jgi:hypothetical protein
MPFDGQSPSRFIGPMFPLALASPGEWVAWWIVLAFFFVGAAFLGVHAGKLRATQDAKAA